MTTFRLLSSLLAWRYIKGNKEKSLSTMALVCFFAIFIGSFALTLVSCIMNGFEKATHDKLRGIHSQIIMRTSKGYLNFNRIKEIIGKEFPEIEACSPVGFKHTLVHIPQQQDTNTVVVLMGIDPHHELETKTISEKLIDSHAKQNFSSLFDKKGIIIGKKMATALQLSIGDSIDLWSSSDTNYNSAMNFEKITCTITALFDTGIEEFDMGIIYCSLESLRSLFNQGVSQININLIPHGDEHKVINALRKRFRLDTYSWKELYPALVSALKLEKYAMFFIFILIVIVASMNIISLLFMYIIQKQQDIAILKACGADQHSINKIFMIIGIGISICAALTGEFTAFLLCLLLQKCPFIHLPDTYYVSHLPVCIDYKIFLLVFLVVAVISSIASYLSVQRSKKLLISSVLKGEIS